MFTDEKCALQESVEMNVALGAAEGLTKVGWEAILNCKQLAVVMTL